MTKDNMELWYSVSVTNPAHTKEVTFGRKITAIDPYQQVKTATKVFGPAGVGWGWEVMEVTYPPNDTVAVRVRLWHGKNDQYIEHWGQNGLYTDNAKEKDDKDCLKKATTDGLTKCLSFIGFNADVFLGMFDDNKYVAEQRALNDKNTNAPYWHGPMVKTKLQARIREFSSNIQDAMTLEDIADLEGAYKAELEQLEIDLPKWWDNDDEEKLGISQRIEARKEEIIANSQTAV